jgi:hypothetical protein
MVLLSSWSSMTRTSGEYTSSFAIERFVADLPTRGDVGRAVREGPASA